MQTNISKNSGTEPILEVKDLTKYYKCEEEDEKIISIIGFLKKKEELGIKGISFDIYRGRAIGLIGKKKCGKSTLLKIISGVIKPSSGKIISGGVKLTDTQLREKVSYISKEPPSSQEYNCTLLENIIQYACRGSKDRCDVIARAEKLIEDFGLKDYKFKEVIKLPGTVRSKLFIIRGFMSHKSILCFDQPLSCIGEENLETFKRYMDELVHSGKTIIIASDEEDIINNICDEMITL
jgi:ABC-type multidrug transport system ATPase subunit